jgi:hypothetical protein
MRTITLSLAGLFLLTGCGSAGLTALARMQGQYLGELQRAMPAVVDAHEAALKGVLARAQEAEEQALAGEQTEVIASVIDDAISAAGLNVEQPTRDALHEALERLMKYHRDRLGLTEAARTAREIKARAVIDALSRLNATLPALTSHQQTIAGYLEATRGLPPLGGVSTAQRPQNVEELVERLKAIGRTLEEQFARAHDIYEAARKAAEGDKKP